MTDAVHFNIVVKSNFILPDFLSGFFLSKITPINMPYSPSNIDWGPKKNTRLIHILNSKSQPIISTIKFKNAIIAGATYPSADVFTPSTEPQ